MSDVSQRRTCDAGPGNSPVFATTHWSQVLAACDAASPKGAEALERLCRSYWFPLYAYLRRKGYKTEDAQDLTQEFFARFLERKYLARADSRRGRFRSFLLASLQHFASHEWRRAQAKKRGGGCHLLPWEELSAEGHYQLEVADDLTPDKVFEQRWALALFQEALTRLAEEFAAAGKSEQFDGLKEFLSGEVADGAYAAVAERLGMRSGAVAVAVHRLRQRYAQLVREEIARTVASPTEIDDEMRYLIRLMTG